MLSYERGGGQQSQDCCALPHCPTLPSWPWGCCVNTQLVRMNTSALSFRARWAGFCAQCSELLRSSEVWPDEPFCFSSNWGYFRYHVSKGFADRIIPRQHVQSHRLSNLKGLSSCFVFPPKNNWLILADTLVKLGRAVSKAGDQSARI